MKRLTIVTLVVLFSMVLAACGGAATPAPAPTAAPVAAAPTAAPAPTTAPEPTMVPEATQAPAAAPASAGVGAKPPRPRPTGFQKVSRCTARSRLSLPSRREARP